MRSIGEFTGYLPDVDEEAYWWLAGGLAAVSLAYLLRNRMGSILGISGVRGQVAGIMNAVIPCKYPDSTFQTVTGGQWAPNYGSSCGFLPSYLWDQLGVTDCRIINRATSACMYTPGDNISRIENGGKALGAWVADLSQSPQQGDVVLCSNGPPSSEHVFVVNNVDGTTWNSWDGGHLTADAMNTASREFDGSRLQFVDGPRAVVGWVDLELLLAAVSGG